MANRSTPGEKVEVMYDKHGDVVCEGDEVKVLWGIVGEVVTIQTVTLSKATGPEPVASVHYNGKFGQFLSDEIELLRLTRK